MKLWFRTIVEHQLRRIILVEADMEEQALVECNPPDQEEQQTCDDKASGDIRPTMSQALIEGETLHSEPIVGTAEVSTAAAHDNSWHSSFYSILHSTANESSEAGMYQLLSSSQGISLQQNINENFNILLDVCKWYKHDDLPAVIRLICNNGIDVNAVNSKGENALFLLIENEPACREAIYLAVGTLVELGIDAKRTDSRGRTPLMAFLSFIFKSDPCCYYRGLKFLHETRYWNTVDLFVSTGVDVNQRDEHSRSALYLILNGLASMKTNDETICEECMDNYFPLSPRAQALIVLDGQLFYKAFYIICRLVDRGAQQLNNFSIEFETALLYVCSRFGGGQLLSLVRLFCSSGVSVNATTRDNLNAIGVLREFNRSEASIANRLAEFLTSFGFTV